MLHWRACVSLLCYSALSAGRQGLRTRQQMSRVRSAVLGVAVAGAGYVAMRQLIWGRAIAAVDGAREVSGEVPGAAEPQRLAPPSLLPPAAATLLASARAAAEAAWRDLQ